MGCTALASMSLPKKPLFDFSEASSNLMVCYAERKDHFAQAIDTLKAAIRPKFPRSSINTAVLLGAKGGAAKNVG